jgi:hypothetical protein
MKMSLWKSLFFVAALGRADANAQQPAANTVDGHRLAAQKAAGLEFPGLLSRLGILGICGQGFVVEDLRICGQTGLELCSKW